MFSPTSAGWFISRITQNLLNGFPWKLDGGWISTQDRTHELLVQLRIKGQIYGVYIPLFLEDAFCESWDSPQRGLAELPWVPFFYLISAEPLLKLSISLRLIVSVLIRLNPARRRVKCVFGVGWSPKSENFWHGTGSKVLMNVYFAQFVQTWWLHMWIYSTVKVMEKQVSAKPHKRKLYVSLWFRLQYLFPSSICQRTGLKCGRLCGSLVTCNYINITSTFWFESQVINM